MITLKKKRPSSVLGLAFEGNRLDVVALRRNNGTFQNVKSLSATLALSPLTGDPELVGREIRNHLEQAGIRERRCVVCLPQNWALTLQIALPELSEADLDSFLQIEAERGFPSAPETLMIAQSVASCGKEKQGTLIAIARAQIANLEEALKAALLKPASFSLGLPALHSATEQEGVVALALGSASVGLQATCGGGIAALRFLEGATEAEGGPRRLDADVLAREIRITIGQLPASFQTTIRKLRIFGRGDLARQFTEDIKPRAAAMGLSVELIEKCSPGHFENVLPAEGPLSSALALAARYLGGAPHMEFLPPKVHPLRQLFTSQVSSKKLVFAGAVAGVIAFGIVAVFGYQEWQISKLESRWHAMEKGVKDLEYSQLQTRRFRPWFDESLRTLTILRKVTEAFPEDGNVTAKSVEIREPSTVTCSAVARDSQAYLRLIDKLRATKGIAKVSVEQVRGQSPVLFTFNFQWEGENNHAN